VLVPFCWIEEFLGFFQQDQHKVYRISEVVSRVVKIFQAIHLEKWLSRSIIIKFLLSIARRGSRLNIYYDFMCKLRQKHLEDDACKN